MSKATLTIASKNYGSWSLRGWLLCKMANLDFAEQHVGTDDPSTRAELLLLSPSFLVPGLTHDGLKVWDTLAIAEYLNEMISYGCELTSRDVMAFCRVEGHLDRPTFNPAKVAMCLINLAIQSLRKSLGTIPQDTQKWA